jgi:hypothetical protein
MSIAQLAAFIASHLAAHGIEVVLSGGACVAIYSKNKYVSQDLDFVGDLLAKRADVKAAMEEIGFREKGRSFFHPQTKFSVEFPPGPLAIGDEFIKKTAVLKETTGNLHLLSPTDCVKNRLAGYYHWGDLQSLEQALLVTHAQKVDLTEVERWSKKEGKLAEFSKFRARLQDREGSVRP